ncbi:hypothetical protein [Nostoc sp.]|uniref:hypothetical protein n=1 Tax=Nostoc sp. TaxID=1180 RepID=UPI002FFA7D4A
MSLSLGNAANWSLYYHETFAKRYDISVQDPDYGFIGELVIPVLFDSPYLTVKAVSSTAKPTWKQLGYVKQKIRVGIEAGGTVDAFLNRRYLLSLNQPTLLTFDPNIASTYALWFRPFNWFDDVTLSIYTYTGDTSTGGSSGGSVDLTGIQSDVTAIKTDVSNLVELIAGE